MSGIYDVTLAPGASERIQVVGTRAKVISAPAGSVVIKLDVGESYTLLEGQGVRKADANAQGVLGFGMVTVRNPQSIAQTVLVFIGDDNFEDTRVTGNVRVIDSAADKTRLGKQFFAGQDTAVDPANVSASTIYANGKTVAVRALILQSAVAGNVLLGYGSNIGTAYNVGSSGGVPNKLIGGAVSTYRTSKGVQVATTPTGAETPGWVPMGYVYLPANTPVQMPLQTPFVISGTQVLVANGMVVNRQVNVIHEAEELD